MRKGKKQPLPGTVDARFHNLMAELEKRYPDASPYPRGPLPETRHLAAIDYDRERLRSAVRIAKIAMDDWLHSCAPEFSGEEAVDQTNARLMSGGIVHYIATITEHLTKVLKESENGNQN